MTHSRDCSPQQHPDIILARIQTQLEWLAENQEALAEGRKAVLLERSGFRSFGKQVQAQRSRTGDAEVAFMNALRKFFNDHGSTFPLALTTAYDRVQEERDKLGSLEIDYYQNEEALASKEWELFEKENDFYQYTLEEHFSEELFDNGGRNETTEPETSHSSSKPAALPSLVQYQAAKAEEHELVTRFNALRHERVGLLFVVGTLHLKTTHTPGFALDNAEAYNGYFDLLEALVACKVRNQRMKVELLQYSIPAAIILFPNSPDPPPSNEQTYHQSGYDGVAHSLPITDRISEWLMEYLHGNAPERILYFNILQNELDAYGVSSFGYASWEDAAPTFWLSDQSEQIIKAEEDPYTVTLQSGHVSQDNVYFASEPIVRTARYFEPVFNSKPRSLLDHENQWSCREGPAATSTVVERSRDLPLHDRMQESLRDLIVHPLLENRPKQPLLNGDRITVRPEMMVRTTPSNITATNHPSSYVARFPHSITPTEGDKPSTINYPSQDTLQLLASSRVSKSPFKATEGSRYDSCQEPEANESRPTATSLPEAVDTKTAQIDVTKHDVPADLSVVPTVDTNNVKFNDSPNNDKSVCSIRVWNQRIPEDGVSTPSRLSTGPNGIKPTRRCEIPSLGGKSALRHDIVQSPTLCTPSLSRPRSY